jgi:hypothetical protein
MRVRSRGDGPLPFLLFAVPHQELTLFTISNLYQVASGEYRVLPKIPLLSCV